MPRRPRTIPRKAPRQGRSQATVQAILDATARILVAGGYDRASTNRIALAAGVSIGSLYQYFPSKEALVASLVERHIDQMTAVIHKKLAELEHADITTAAREIVGAMLDAHLVDPKLHKVLMEQVPRTGRLEKVLGVEQQIEALVKMYLYARAAKGEIRCKNLDVAAFVLCNTVEGVTHAAMLQHTVRSAGANALAALPRDALVAELSDMLVRYVKA